MSAATESLRLYEQELLQKADLLALSLAGLKVADPARASSLVGEIVQRLERVIPEGGNFKRAEEGAAPSRPYLVQPPRGDEFEEFITGLLTDSPKGMSVQEIVEHMDEADIAMKRPTLVVRLHRMARAGKLTAFAHGHYALSEAQRVR
jgi:hypothetical protein